MSRSVPAHLTIDEWIAREAIPFSVVSPESFNAAVDRMMDALGASVQVLGFGEALHGSEDLLVLRNRLFQRLVERHDYSAIAIESSFPRGRIVDEYAVGRGTVGYDVVREAGFSHGFGRSEANRELVEWMRRYNEGAAADDSQDFRLSFYGFDSPTEMMGTDSPRQLLRFALDYLESIDHGGGERRRRIEELLGADAHWENPAAMMDSTKSVGMSPAAAALRVETEELISELQRRRPELSAATGRRRYLEAEQHALVARRLLNYHAELARSSADRTARLLGIRDVIMADNLAYAVERERGRGRVLAFAHNHHLKLGPAQWQLGPDLLTWWPAGAHLHEMLGPAYAVIGSAIGASRAHGIGQPEAGTLESRLTAAPGPARFILTYRGSRLPAASLADVPTRWGSTANPGYFPLTGQSLIDFDGLLVLDSIA